MSFVFGKHERMKDLERRVAFLASSGLPVLIEGEPGTGKEALAELLHARNGIDMRFTRIVCRKSGLVTHPEISMVNGQTDLNTPGTIFLKNIHLLSSAAQEQLLAALELQPESRDSKPGSAPAARLLSSATESLDILVGQGEFNATLFHRLSAYRIYLPALRERREDISELFTKMVESAANGAGAPPPVPSRLLDGLLAYNWPGNVRELQNIARTYVVSSHVEEIIEELNNRSRLTPATAERPRSNPSLKEQVKGASQNLESEIILRTLEQHRWNRRRAAEFLQISYRSLLYKMKSCNLRVQP
jgi:two-component system response regulator AtoC